VNKRGFFGGLASKVIVGVTEQHYWNDVVPIMMLLMWCILAKR